MVKAIAAHAPLALVIDAPLSWGEPAPDFIPELADALLPLPHVIAGIDVSTGSGTLADGPALQRLPQITNLNDESHALLIATEVKAAPAAAIASKVELGCHSSADPEQLAMAYRVAQRVVPSMLLQALTAVTNTPFSQQRLSTGGGAGLHLGDGVYVPLDERACLKLANSSASAQMPTIDALDLMTPTLAGDESSDLTKALGTGKVIVLGLDKAAPLARGITEALARPRIRELLGWQQWSIWGAAALLGMHLLHRPRAKALSRMLLLLFLALTTSYLAFQNNLTWCPPAIPAMIIAVSGVFARMFGKPVNTASTNGMEEAQSE